jgi:hypothetical protein
MTTKNKQQLALGDWSRQRFGIVCVEQCDDVLSVDGFLSAFSRKCLVDR